MFKKKQEEKVVSEAVNAGPEAKKEEESTESEATIAEATEIEPQKEEKKEVVSYGKYARETSELKQRIAELEQQNEISKQDLKEYTKDLDRELEEENTAKNKADIEAKFSKRLDLLEAEKHQEQQKKVLEELFKTAIENNPEYEGVVNKDVIFKLALDKSNNNKKMSEIIKETYGSIEEGTGKKGMETKTSNSNDGPDSIDFNQFDRLSEEDQLAVLDDPKLKAEYNKFVESQLDI